MLLWIGFSLNISSIRLVTTKPPAILTDEMSTDNEANACGKDPGKYPPPKINNPPTAVIPEMALVMIQVVCEEQESHPKLKNIL